jgi:putative oxidoreductase
MFLSRYTPQLHSVLRFMSGLLFMQHGLQKFFHFPPVPPAMAAMMPKSGPQLDFLLAGGAIELVGGFLIAVGFYSRWAAFIAAGEMAVAYWLVHFGMSHSFYPATNGGDLAVLFCFVFLYLAGAGPGPIALNQK